MQPQRTRKEGANLRAVTWGRLPGESARAHAAFQSYLELGPGRSLVAVGQKCNKSRSILGRWSGRWRWVERAAAYDAHMRAVAQRGREAEAAARAIEMERRRVRAQDEAWAAFEALKRKADQMLKWPLVEQKTETVVEGRIGPDGQKYPVTVTRTVITPAKWDFNTLARLLEVAMKMSKIGAGLDPAFGLHLDLDIDLDALSDEQIDRMCAGEDPVQVLARPRLSARSGT